MGGEAKVVKKRNVKSCNSWGKDDLTLSSPGGVPGFDSLGAFLGVFLLLERVELGIGGIPPAGVSGVCILESSREKRRSNTIITGWQTKLFS
jgi:hypothetical protein